MKKMKLLKFAALSVATITLLSGCSFLEKDKSSDDDDDQEEIEESVDEDEEDDKEKKKDSKKNKSTATGAFDHSILIDYAESQGFSEGSDFVTEYSKFSTTNNTGFYLKDQDADAFEQQFDGQISLYTYIPYREMNNDSTKDIENYSVMCANRGDVDSVYVIDFNSEESAKAFYNSVYNFLYERSNLEHHKEYFKGDKGEENGVEYFFCADGTFENFVIINYLYQKDNSIIAVCGFTSDCDSYEATIGELLEQYDVPVPDMDADFSSLYETDETEEPEETDTDSGVPSYAAKYEFPSIPNMELEEDLKTSYETYVVDFIAENIGLSATFDMEAAKSEDIASPEKDYLPNISGVNCYTIKDLDSDGTDDMLVFGFVQLKSDKADYSYDYAPFIMLCQVDYDTIKVTDTMVYKPVDPENNSYGSTLIHSTMTSCYNCKGYISSDNTILLSYFIRGFVGDGSYGNVLEFKVEDHKIVPTTMIYQQEGGSDGFKFIKYDLLTEKSEELNEASYPETVFTLQYGDTAEELFEIDLTGKDNEAFDGYNVVYNYENK